MQMHGKRLPLVEFSSPEFCLPLAQNANPQPPVWNLDISNLNITKSSVQQTIFFTSVTVNHTGKVLDKTKPRCSEQILPVL